MKSLKIGLFIIVILRAVILVTGCGTNSVRYNSPEYVYVNSFRATKYVRTSKT